MLLWVWRKAEGRRRLKAELTGTLGVWMGRGLDNEPEFLQCQWIGYCHSCDSVSSLENWSYFITIVKLLDKGLVSIWELQDSVFLYLQGISACLVVNVFPTEIC